MAAEERLVKTWSSVERFWVGALVVALFIRLTGLSRELWLDETYSAYSVSLSLANMLDLLAGDVHPPAYYVLLYGWSALFGTGSSDLRWCSFVMFGLAAFSLAYVASRLAGRRFALLVSTLFVLAPVFVRFALEVRMYALLALAAVWLVLGHWRVAVQGEKDRKYVLLYAAAGALALYTHYSAVFLVAGLLLHGVLFHRPHVTRIAGSYSLMGLLFAPWAPILWRQYGLKKAEFALHAASHSDPASLMYGLPNANVSLVPELARSLAVLLGIVPAQPMIAGAVLALPVLATLLMLAFALRRGDPWARMLACTGTCLVIGLVMLKTPSTRYFLGVVPLLLLAMAHAVQQRRALAISLAAVYLVGFARQVQREEPKPWTHAVAQIKKSAAADDRVLVHSLYGQVPFDYHARQAGLRIQSTGFPESVYEWWARRDYKGWGSPVLRHSDVERLLPGLRRGESKRLWVVLFESEVYDGRGALVQALRSQGRLHKVSRDGEETVRVYLFEQH